MEVFHRWIPSQTAAIQMCARCHVNVTDAVKAGNLAALDEEHKNCPLAECAFCSEPISFGRQGRLGLGPALYCDFHNGWFAGTTSIAIIEDLAGRKIQWEGMAFEDMQIPYAPKLEKKSTAPAVEEK